MTFFEALYGSQYQELVQKGKDGDKGRFNANIFLSVFVILILFLAIAIVIGFSPGASEKFNSSLHSIFGDNNGRTIGRLLALPLMFICYFIITKTVGSKAGYKKIIDRFIQLPDEEKKKANKKILVPFFIVLASLFILVMAA